MPESSTYVENAQMSSRSGDGGQNSALDEANLLELVACGHPLPEILQASCRSAEEAMDGWACGIYLIDWSGPNIKTFAAPNLPASFSESLCDLPLTHITGPAGSKSCLEASMAEENLNPKLFWCSAAFHNLATGHDLKSWWSTPIRSSAGHLLGSLLLMHREAAIPPPLETTAIVKLTHIIGIAVERDHVNATLDATLAELGQVVSFLTLSASIAVEITQPLSAIVINAGTALRILGATPMNVEGAREILRRTLRDCARASDRVMRLRSLLSAKTEAHAPSAKWQNLAH